MILKGHVYFSTLSEKVLLAWCLTIKIISITNYLLISLIVIN